MTFTSPLWLFALLPWAGGVLWLLWGRRRKSPVPFLELWRGPALQKPAKRALQPPPIFLTLAILATLLAILAAGGPMLAAGHAGAGGEITIIVDRGMSMSANSGGVPRFVAAARQADAAIKPLFDGATVNLIEPPGSGPIPATVGNWLGTVTTLAPTAVDTQAVLEEAIRERLLNSGGPVVVLSDRALPMDDPRLVQFAPTTPVENIAIVQIAARETPVPQVMVRIRNDSQRKTLALTVKSESQQATQNIDLPPNGQERNYFIDLPKIDATIEAAIDAHDDQPADDRAWLTREGSHPKIEARAPLPPALRRIVDVYTRTRPPTGESPAVAIVASEADLPGQAPAAWVATPAGPIVRGPVTAVSHPVTTSVNWSTLPAEIATAGDAPRGWQPIVTVGDHVVVAVRTEPTRKVWIGFDAPSWSTTPDFVVFWANVFTWLGQGQERFAAYPLADYDPSWKPAEPTKAEPGTWPGIYHAESGLLRAFDAPNATPTASAPTTPDWQQRLTAARDSQRHEYPLAPLILIAALVCLTAAAGTWKVPTKASRQDRHEAKIS